VIHRRRSLKLLASVFALSLVAAACGGDDDDAGAPQDTEGTETTQGGEQAQGGTLVIGAEQEPDCVDWISSCAGASWGYWTMNVHTMPRSFDVVQGDDGNWTYEPSILLDGEPELQTDPQQVVTYSISDEAVWSDGEPIVCADYAYTWDQIKNGDDIYDRTGYANIASVDCPDDKTAVVTFETPFASWKSLFGGQYGIYPSHLLEGQDRNAMMANGYDFSGGPWIIEEWAKGDSVTLIPNDNYWGEKPLLDSVVFRFVADTASEFQAFNAGEVSMIYPQPQIDVIDQINAGLSGAESFFTPETGNIEALWMNNAAFPFDSLAVRQAFAYGLDRDAIVERLFGGLDINEASQSLNAPIVGRYSDLEAFSGYTQDLDQVESLMTGDGWTRNADGIWEKDGQAANIEFITTAGNARRELTQEIVIEQARAAGFNVTVANQEAGTFFGETLPQGNYQLGLYAQVLTSPDPSLCNLFCSVNIPTAENGFSGQNWQRVNIPEVDPLLQTVDTSLDEDERAENQRAADAILAENMVSLPLDPLPNILLWQSSIVGEITDHPTQGPFWNMNTWSLG